VQELSIALRRGAQKTVRISVSPPTGEVRVSAPLFMRDEAIRIAIRGRIDWIRKQKDRSYCHSALTKASFGNGERVFWLGQQYKLSVIIAKGTGHVLQNRPGHIDLFIPANTTVEKQKVLLYQWYRQQLKLLIPELLNKWEAIVGVHAENWGIKRMKTRWGSCNTSDRRIWLNLELACRPLECIEFVLVHELVHLQERSHNARFKALMTRFMPLWQEYQKILRLPLSPKENT